MRTYRLKENKKAVLRILEAFIAVMMVLSVVLVIVVNQRSSSASRDQEIVQLQRNILDYVSQDENLRSQILSGNTAGVIEKIRNVVPPWVGYSVRICSYNDICSICPGTVCPMLDQISKKQVYANEILLVANLTYYVPESAAKLKLFFWEGNYTPPMPTGPVCGNGICEPGETIETCPNDCHVQVYLPVLKIDWWNLRKNYGTKPACAVGYDTWYYYDMNITETSGQAGTAFGSRTRCFNWIESTVPKQSCDPLKTTMPSGMPASISAGQKITVYDRWFCVIPGFTYNMTEAFYNDSSGMNQLFNYSINNVD